MLEQLREHSTLLVQPQAPIDEALKTRLEFATGTDGAVYEKLLPTKAVIYEAKVRFYTSGMVESPDLRPTDVDFEEIGRQEAQLLEFKAALPNISDDPMLAQVYRWRINEIIGNLRMLRAAGEGDTKRFDAYNRFIYGEPKREIFEATADWFTNIARGNVTHESPAIRQAARQVVNLFGKIPGDRGLLIPSDEVFQNIRTQHFREGGYYGLLLSGIELPQSGKVTPEIGEIAIEQMLQNLEGEYSRAQNPSGAYWGISHSRNEFMGPLDYSLPVKRFIGLPLGHEGGSHILERMNGMRLPLRLMGSGLDRYEQGNEGRAVIREQVPYETFEEFARLTRWEDILRRHFAISLGAGLMGKEMSFSEVYQRVNAVDSLLELLKSPEDVIGANTRADKRTWDLLQRVLKGTDGLGGAYLKDKIYLEGNVACWQLAKEYPELIEYGDLGKFDITNPRHLGILQAKGILPVLD